MSDLYKKTYRGYLIDHHSPDPPIVTLDKLDINEYEKFFKEANINNLMLYCKDHWGVSYYDTKTGKKHPGLKEDWIKKVRKVLKKLNIEFNAYYCLEYEMHAPTVHPEWSTLKADGTPLILEGRMPKWKIPCYETGYRDYVLDQLKEIVEGYSPDSLFLDIFGKSLCYCDACKEKYLKQYGYELPKEEKKLKEANNDVTEFLDNCAKDMLKDIMDTVKGIDPKIKVTINFAALYTKEIRDMLDYQFTEPWAGNWLSGAYARDTAKGQYPQLGPGDVSEVYNYQPKSIYILAAAQIAAQGCRIFMYSGSQHPDGTLEHEEAKRIGAAYSEVEKFEKYLSNREVIADIGIIQSDDATKMGNNTAVAANAIKRVKLGSKHRDSLLGAMKLCDWANYTWNVVPDKEVTYERIKDYKLLILPNVFYISLELKKALLKYVKNGGLILSSYETGLYEGSGKIKNKYELRDLFGCEYEKTIDEYKDNIWGGYIKIIEDDIWKYTPDTMPPVSQKRHKVSLKEGKALGYFVDPATKVTDKTWVNWWSPPPSHETCDPSIVENSIGKGRSIFAAFDMFDMGNKEFNLIKNMFKGIIKKYIKNPSIKLETKHDNILGFVCYKRNNKDEIIIHQISHMAEIAKGDTPKISGGEIILSDKYNVSKADIVYPNNIELEINKNKGKTKINLPDLKIHQIIKIKVRK